MDDVGYGNERGGVIDEIAEKIIYVYYNNLKESLLSKSKSILKTSPCKNFI